jgi:hypothetical protein
MMRLAAIAAAAILTLITAARAGEATPLFSDDAAIDIKLIGPIKEITRTAAKSTDSHPATLELVGASAETHAIELSARGLSRRERKVCQFPPLRVRFVEKPGDESLFRKQGTLKLVTHCRSAASFQQYTLLEYTAYRLLNALTPASFRVRLANVEYIDEKTGKRIAARIGFFIEDVDDVAKRVDMKEVERPQIEIAQLDPEAAATAILYQYMIGNLDWDVLYGPPGESCCHNGKMIGARADAETALVPAPYDFDYSGFVDAPYATPPEGFSISSVRTRVYRGFCRHNDETAAAAARFRGLKAKLVATLDGTPGLANRTRSKAARYLGGFFDIIEDAGTVETKLLGKCRG